MSGQTQPAPLFFLIAGEASGDLLGARLMRALKARGPARFAGVGGPRMAAEGMDLLFPQEELAHMGLVDLLWHLPNILRRIGQTARAVQAAKPAALITIDSPDFSFRVAKKLKGLGIPLLHYVASTVWAWRPGRAKKMARFLDHLLALLPFEPPYFTREGLDCTFVGHPLVESGADRGDGARFRKKNHIPDNALLLALLPGSRVGEVSRLLPVFRETVARLAKTNRQLRVVIPVVPGVAGLVEEAVKNWPTPVYLTRDDGDKYDAFAACRAALACSGTVSVELAMAGLPTVIAYKASALTVALYRRFIKVKYVTLLNLMRDRMVMPELLQEACVPERLAQAVGSLLSDEKERLAQKEELQKISAWLGRGAFVPSEKAAETVWKAAFPPRSRRLRVLQIIPALGTGGAEQACVDIAKALVARGEKAIVVSSGGRRVADLEKAGARHILRNVKTKNPFRILRNAFWLAKLIRRGKIDIVHARSRAPAWSAMLACKMTGAHYVTTFHAAYKFGTLFPEKKNGEGESGFKSDLLRGNFKKAYNRAMANAERVIAISPFIARHVHERYGVAESRIALVNRGVDIKGLRRESVTAERRAGLLLAWGVRSTEAVIVCPGRLSPIKGQDFFIRVLARLKEKGAEIPVTLFVGDDQGRAAYTQKLKDLIRENKLEDKARLVGACADMAAAYSLAALVVVPSKVPEGFGRVPVEAMAAGVPVIASALGATLDTVVDGKTGWLVAAEDVEAWASRVEKTLAMSVGERAVMARESSAHVAAHFDTKTMEAETLAVYDAVARGEK